jgi:hypothetical protein
MFPSRPRATKINLFLFFSLVIGYSSAIETKKVDNFVCIVDN